LETWRSHLEMSNELLSLIESDIKWLEDAAENCEQNSLTIASAEMSAVQLLFSAVYRERAEAHRRLIEATRERLGAIATRAANRTITRPPRKSRWLTHPSDRTERC
jgi:hypothetical protein